MAVPQPAPAVARQGGAPRTSTNQLAAVRTHDDAVTPVDQSGCFQVDRVIKSGYVEKRTRKTKVRL